ncbi:hypothetical protein C942_02371 [Photobacterium marinum]|uniref:Uncharacterized protein n=1 Tax=Photobacterium marinum TaxID=1056511 RepID=L8J8M9_9GAMM|nr:hypothetical protein C942_02371 [Photobacterium marinum]
MERVVTLRFVIPYKNQRKYLQINYNLILMLLIIGLMVL